MSPISISNKMPRAREDTTTRDATTLSPEPHEQERGRFEVHLREATRQVEPLPHRVRVNSTRGDVDELVAGIPGHRRLALDELNIVRAQAAARTTVAIPDPHPQPVASTVTAPSPTTRSAREPSSAKPTLGRVQAQTVPTAATPRSCGHMQRTAVSYGRQRPCGHRAGRSSHGLRSSAGLLRVIIRGAQRSFRLTRSASFCSPVASSRSATSLKSRSSS